MPSKFSFLPNRVKVFLLLISSIIFLSFPAFCQWEETADLQGGSYRQMTVFNGSIFVTRDQGEISISTDAGSSWSQSMNGMPASAQIRFLYNHGETLMASTTGYGIWESTDGINWSRISPTYSNLTTSSDEIFKDGDDIFVSSAFGGIYYSTDNGQNWNFDDNGLYLNSFTLYKGDLYGATYSTIYKLDREQYKWQEVDLGEISETGYRSILGTEAAFFIACQNGIAVSADDFASWDIEDTGFESILVMKSSADSIYAVGSGNIYHTIDNGTNWRTISGVSQNPNPSMRGALLTEGRVFSATDKGLYATMDDGDTWDRSETGLNGTAVVSFVSNDTYLYAGTDYYGISRSNDNGDTWEFLQSISDLYTYGPILGVLSEIDDKILAGTFYDIVLSEDDGDNWETTLDTPPNNVTRDIVVDEGKIIATVNGLGVYYSEDTASSWIQMNVEGMEVENGLTALEVVGDTVFVIGSPYDGGHLYVSTDFGNTWADRILIDGSYFVMTDALKWYDGYIYAGTKLGLRRSDDLGQTWESVFYSVAINDLQIIGGKIYVTTNNGVLMSSIHHDTWTVVSDNIKGEYIHDLHIGETHAFAGTYNKGIWRRPLSEINLEPVFLSTVGELTTQEETGYILSLDDLNIFDPDNTYPDGFSLSFDGGFNYLVEGSTVVPLKDFVGTLKVNLRVSDGIALSDLFSIDIEVTPVNDPPVITGTSVTGMDKNTSLEIVTNQLEVEDVDNTYPDDFTITVLDGVNYTLNGNTITPVQDFLGDLTISVKVNDGTADSEPYDFTIQVEEPNVIPVITGLKEPLSMDEDEFITFKLDQFIVEDSDGDFPNGFSLIPQSGENYSLNGNIIRPDPNYYGKLNSEMVISDGEDVSEKFKFEIEVTPVNDAPKIVSQTSEFSITSFDTLEIELDDFQIEDVDNSTSELTLSLTEGDNYQILNGTLVPEKTFSGVLSVPVQVSDGQDTGEILIVEVNVMLVKNIELINPIGDLGFEEGFGTWNIDISDVFSMNEGVDFGAVSLNNSIVSVELLGQTLKLTENGLGSSTVIVTASDLHGGVASDTINILVSETVIAGLGEGFEVSIFPNPVKTDKFFLEISEDIHGMKIMDQSGRSYPCDFRRESKDQYIISVTNLEPSVYFLMILLDTRILGRKFAVDR